MGNIHDINDLNLIEPFEKFPGAVILNEDLGHCLQLFNIIVKLPEIA